MSKLGPPPTPAEIKGNLDDRPRVQTGEKRYINFRVSEETFIEIKTAALQERRSLGDYLIMTHDQFARTKR